MEKHAWYLPVLTISEADVVGCYHVPQERELERPCVGAPCAPAALSSQGHGSQTWEQLVHHLSGAAGEWSAWVALGLLCPRVHQGEKGGVMDDVVTGPERPGKFSNLFL